jgi:uncharacterized protein YlaI
MLKNKPVNWKYMSRECWKRQNLKQIAKDRVEDSDNLAALDNMKVSIPTLNMRD